MGIDLLIYEGQSINSDNGSISQKILIELELLSMQNVDMGVTYSCVNYDVFIATGFDAMRICILHLECSWPRSSQFWPLFLGG